MSPSTSNVAKPGRRVAGSRRSRPEPAPAAEPKERRTFGGTRLLGSGRWQAYYPGLDGKRVPAPDTFATKVAATAWLDALEADRSQGSWQDPNAARQRLDHYAISWLKTHELSPGTRGYYSQLLDSHFLSTLGLHELRQIQPPVVKAWFAALADTTGPTACARSYALLKEILNEAVSDGAIAANPCRIKGGATTRHAETRPLSIPEVRQVAGRMPKRYRLLVLLGAASGLRYGELIGLKREDVDLERLTLTVRRSVRHGKVGAPKTASSYRTVELPSIVDGVLRAHFAAFVAPGRDAWVFTSGRGVPPANNWVNQCLKAAALRVGIDESRFHATRHTAGTTTAETGATTKEVMERLGHATPDATLRYQHVTGSRASAVAQAIDAAARAGGHTIPLRPRPERSGS